MRIQKAADGAPYSLSPSLGYPSYAQDNAPGGGAYHSTSQIYTANVQWALPADAMLVSISSYSRNQLEEDSNSFGKSV